MVMGEMKPVLELLPYSAPTTILPTVDTVEEWMFENWTPDSHPMHVSGSTYSSAIISLPVCSRLGHGVDRATYVEIKLT